MSAHSVLREAREKYPAGTRVRVGAGRRPWTVVAVVNDAWMLKPAVHLVADQSGTRGYVPVGRLSLWGAA